MQAFNNGSNLTHAINWTYSNITPKPSKKTIDDSSLASVISHFNDQLESILRDRDAARTALTAAENTIAELEKQLLTLATQTVV